MAQKVNIRNLNPNDVLHPEDKKMMARLNKIPKFKDLLDATVVRYDSAVTGITFRGNGFSLTRESSPAVYGILRENCQILGVDDTPLMSSSWAYRISSESIGGKKPRIILSTGAIDLLSKDELSFLIGHELGHIMCGHKPYHTLLELLYSPLIDQVDHFSLASVIKMPMLEWYRISHYTADRVGLLCCQNINAALSAMIKMAGCPKKYFDKVDVKSILKQAEVFENSSKELMTGMLSKFIVRATSKPWMVVRAKELVDWCNSDSYKSLIGR